MFKISRILVVIAKIFIFIVGISLIGIVGIQTSSLFRSFCEQRIMLFVTSVGTNRAQIAFTLQNLNIVQGTIAVANLRVMRDGQEIVFDRGQCFFSWKNLLSYWWGSDNYIKTSFSLSDGSVCLFGNTMITRWTIQGNVSFQTHAKSADRIEECSLRSIFDLHRKSNKVEHCFIFGNIKGPDGHLKLRSNNNLLAADIYKQSQTLKLSSHFDLKALSKLFPHPYFPTGRAIVQSHLYLDTYEYDLRAKVKEFTLKHSALEALRYSDIRIFAHKHNDKKHTCVVKDFDNKDEILKLSYQDQKIQCFLKGSSILHKFYAPDASCNLVIDAELKENSIYGTIRSIDTVIAIPNIYNVIKNIHANFKVDLKDQRLYIDNLLVGFHKGTVAIENLSISKKYKKIIIPLKLSNLFFSFNKNFFAYLNGQPLLVYDNESPELTNRLSLKGTIEVNKGGVRYSFNAPLSAANTSKNSINVDLDLIANLKNIEVTHNFFDLAIGAVVTITGNAQQPKVGGMITIEKGLIKFPSQNLSIAEARIYLSEQEVLLDINAKGHINKYDVTLRMLGPSTKPSIIFESEPLLTTEQIIALLVTGSANTALSCMVPNLFIQNLESLLFGSSSSFTDQPQSESVDWVKYILKLLKNVRIAATEETELSEKGKYKVEFDITNELRATINNDFVFEKPSQIGVEYDLSDNCALKGSKDSNNNFSGELEFRWKV